ncbi:type II toxin-antitoxin system YafQ family toxin [Massilia scottii]|uniref:type II toxin-antitoxin system YafQ family toxin n=1 Tax=Massilia scottii TaxID=3057166 RepID=UPI0027969039|nr:type II toxin-antitoxin system YafQ family toxin [Massilia sp. CCM 9029]MDQ1833928.1 type II toxin-antitoxin system YafQ family toxin [Massilia sp. CCM 9029]
MTSKKPAASKRTTLPRQSSYTKRFLQDWSALSHPGRYDMTLLIANDGPLPAQWRDHQLSGKWERHRECHLGGDFLLVYLLDDSGKCPSLVISSCGTHADIFG